MSRRIVMVVAVALALAAIATALSSVGSMPARATEAAAMPASPNGSMSRSVIRGQHVFVQNCAMCHGDGGQGDGELAAELRRRENVRVGNLTDRAEITRLGVDGIRAVVTHGGAHTGRSEFMPRWADTLSTGQIDDVAQYVAALPDLKPGVTSSTLRGYYRTPPGIAAEGRTVFVHQCIVCHGLQGKGDGTMAPSILRLHQVRVRDLNDTAYLSTKTDRQLFLAISGGGGEVGRSPYMPHWGGYLSPEHIKDVIAYVRSISKTKSTP